MAVYNGRYVRVDELFTDPRPTTIIEDVRKQIERENDRPITTSEAYRRAGFDAEAWSELADRPL